MLGREPKYKAVVNWVIENISNGTFKMGERLLSENELSEKFGLSRQTVRHAIDVLEQQKFVSRIQGSGTYVGQNGKTGRPERYLNVAVISTYSDSYIFPPILRGIERVLSAAGYTTQIAFTGNRIDGESKALKNIIEKNTIDGLIVEPTKSAIPNSNMHYYKQLMDQQLPILFFNSSYPELKLPIVALDDRKIGRKAVEYLFEKGHRKIGGIFKCDDGQGHLRYSGYMEGIIEHGLNVKSRSCVWIDTDDIANLELFEDYLFYRLEGCTAVVCYNDEVCYLFTALCQKRGIRIPEDLSIVSVDNSDLATVGDIKITSFPHPMETLGRKAAETMINMIENPYFDGNCLFDSELIERDSVRECEKE
jgi:GntR family transcriptional regulator of arabinose operon